MDVSDVAYLSSGITPIPWKKYRVPPRISAMQWMSDFVARLKQLDKLATITTNESVQSLRVSDDEWIWIVDERMPSCSMFKCGSGDYSLLKLI